MAGESTAKATVISMCCSTAITKGYLLWLKTATPDYVKAASAAGAQCIGLAMDSATTDDATVPVALLNGGGTLCGVVGAAITAGGVLMTDNVGRLTPWVNGGGTVYIVGIALESSSTVGASLLFAPMIQVTVV